MIWPLKVMFCLVLSDQPLGPADPCSIGPIGGGGGHNLLLVLELTLRG
jgi:hypothetical protein